MKKTLSLLLFTAFTITFAFAQDFAKMDKSVLDAAYYPSNAPKRVFQKTAEAKAALSPKIRVLYSRPLKKGRDIFGGLVKFDKPWRVGANEDTEVLFMTDVKFGDQVLKAGRYSMIIVPTAKSWTVNLNTKLDGWGNYSYDENWNIASITVPTQSSDTEIEALSMVFLDKADGLTHLKIGWDKTFVEIPITLK